MRRKTKRILIDSDIIAFKAASAAEVPIKWDGDMWTLHASESTVKQIVDTIVARIVLHTGIKKLVICAGSRENFRKQILPSYKHHRVETRKPMLLGFAKEYLETLGEVKRIPNTETDDVIGILATSASKFDDHIWSEDKDLRTIPGKHIDKNTFEVVTVTEQEANYKWMMQTLTGDTTDGYKGCPGSGPKDAEKTLADCETLSPFSKEVSAIECTANCFSKSLKSAE
jgi:DNA polymerase-1